MAISNINNSNQSAAANRTVAPAAPHTARTERKPDVPRDSTVVTISAHARDLHQEANIPSSSQEHAERIETIARSDEMTQDKLRANAREENKVIEANKKIDEQLYKRINTSA